MAYALIDNSTLTSVQRILGEISIRSNEVVDSDISAFENLIQAILFYDDLIAIDDYKETYREDRKRKFEFIRFINSKSFNLEKIEDKANQELKRFIPTIRGGNFEEENIKRLFDLLKINVICTWDLGDSVYHLTLKLLGHVDSSEFKKYGALSSAIFNELNDLYSCSNGKINSQVKLYNSQGNLISPSTKLIDKLGYEKDQDLSKSFQYFMAGLKWGYLRTVYYSNVAEHLRADVFLHPIRHVSCARYKGIMHGFSGDYLSDVLKNFSILTSKTIESNINVGRLTKITFDVPLMIAWLIQKTKDPSKIIEEAHNIKSTNLFVRVREDLKIIRNIYDDDKFSQAQKEISKIEKDLENALNNIKANYSVKVDSGIHILPMIKIINGVFSKILPFNIPEIDRSFTIPEPIKECLKKKSTATIYRNIAKDLSCIPQLGETYELITKNIHVDPNKREAAKLRVEDPKYLHAKTDWKIPM